MRKYLDNKMVLIYVLAATAPIASSTWTALLNNFVIEKASFTGVEIGILQSLREVPGFLAFASIFVLLFLRQQTFTVLSLIMLGIGTAMTGFFPTAIGLYSSTVIMSVGFHYLETMRDALHLQWLDQKDTPRILGRLNAIRSFVGILVFAMIYGCLLVFDIDYKWIYLVGGGVTVLLALFIRFLFPIFEIPVKQKTNIIIKKEYWLYYGLTFFAGARRQISMVFAGFLLVEKFGFSVNSSVSLLFVNAILNMWTAQKIGKLIGKWGERKALTCEYVGLIIIFTCYAFASEIWMVIILYVLNHLFFAMSIAISTYFQKVANPADIASSAGVSFTINHIAAIVLPVGLGLVWVYSHTLVFLIGTALATCSLILARLIPHSPSMNERTRIFNIDK
jgi:hypothetical protein